MSINHLTFHVQTYLFIDTIKYRHIHSRHLHLQYIYIRIWVLFKSLSVRECKWSSVCFCCTLFVFVFLSFFKDFPSSVSLVSLPLLHFKPAPFISLLSLSATLSLFFLRVFPALFVSLVLFSLVSCFHFFFLAFSHPLPSFFSPPHRS